MYPTQLLKGLPLKYLRITREVIWKEMEQIGERIHIADIPAIIVSTFWIAETYRRLDYNTPKLLSRFEYLDPKKKVQAKAKSLTTVGRSITPEMIPWETIPVELIQKCFDENMELQVTDELLEFMGFKEKSGDSEETDKKTLFDTIIYRSRIRDKQNSGVIVSPLYNQYTDKIIQNFYYAWNEDEQDYERVVVKPRSSLCITRSYHELEWVVRNLEMEDSSSQLLGIPRDLVISTLHNLWKYICKYRKTYFAEEFLKRLAESKVSVEKLREQRFEAEKEYAISADGRYSEDTSKLWEMVK